MLEGAGERMVQATSSSHGAGAVVVVWCGGGDDGGDDGDGGEVLKKKLEKTEFFGGDVDGFGRQREGRRYERGEQFIIAKCGRQD